MDYVYSIRDGNGKQPYKVVGYNNALFLANDVLLHNKNNCNYVVIENTETGEYQVLA